MQNKVTYEFAIIKLVPKVERGEYLNVGVILFSKRKRFLEMRFQLDEKRIQAFALDMDCTQLKAYLKSWELICAGNPKGGEIAQLDLPSRFRWLTAARSTILQCSPVHPGLCQEPQTILDYLFDRYVR